MKKRLLCIVNPIAGSGNGKQVAGIIRHGLDAGKYDFSLCFTEYPGHARELARQAAADGVDVVVAVGGDGTVNETASGLVGSQTALAIVPRGSGNGLAFHLGMPHNIRRDLAIINQGHVVRIDTATINGRPFFCTCGVGYDAKVAMDYAQAGTRGLITYLKKIVENLDGYVPQRFRIATDTDSFETRAFLITCGNANQWGNHCHITPEASLRDGLLDLTILRPFNLLEAAPMAVQLFDFHIYKSHKAESFRSSRFVISHLEETPGAKSQIEAHLDGEAFFSDPTLEIVCVPESLNVVVPVGGSRPL